MTKPIRVQLTKAVNAYPKGAELGFETEAKATSVLGEGAFKVISNQDGTLYEAPRKAAKADDSKGEK